MEDDLFELLDDSTLLMILEQMTLRQQFDIRGVCQRTLYLFETNAWTLVKLGRLTEDEEQLLENLAMHKSAMLQIDVMQQDALLGDALQRDAVHGDAVQRDALHGDAVHGDALQQDDPLTAVEKNNHVYFDDQDEQSND